VERVFLDVSNSEEGGVHGAGEGGRRTRRVDVA
jgi:hypothetical protein